MRITLSGYYGFDNAGDEALLSAITSSIQRLAPEAEFVVLSGDPARTRALHGIPAVYYLNPWQVLQAIRGSDLLISGGGSIFQDVTSARSLPYYISVVAMARALHKPVIFYAQGVGPINRSFSKFLMRLIGNQVNMITLRDQDSMDYLQGIGVTQPPMRVTADPVFALEPSAEDSKRIRSYLHEINPTGAPMIGVSVRAWEPLEGYQSDLASVLDDYAQGGYQVLFIPMAYPQDIAAGEKVAALMQYPALVIQEHFSSQEHLALIAELQLMIGMRLHALIFAASRGVPMAGISYDPKVDGFLKIFGLDSLPPQAEIMRARIQTLIQNQNTHQELVAQSLRLREQADENARLALALLEPQAEADQHPVFSSAESAPETEAAPLSSIGEEPLSFPAEGKTSTGRNFIGVAITIFFSKVLGFFRDILFASTFGTTLITDAYQTIFGLPSLLFSSVGNALSSVNIPDLTYFLHHKSQAERKEYIANLFAQITLIFGVLSLIGVVAAPPLTNLLAPGLEDPVTRIATTLCKIMMPTLLFVNLTYFSAGILQVHGFFLLSSIISIPFNLLIILALIFRGDDIVFLGYVTTAGWFLQFLIQCPRLFRLGYRVFGKISFQSPQVKNLYRNLAPILLGNSVLQICLIVDRSFGTHLPEGTSAALAFGSNLFLTITSVFVVAMSTVVFPRLSQYCLSKDYEKIRALMGTIFQILLYILLPYLLLVLFYHQDIIELVYERGAFNQESTLMTATSFCFYSLAVLGYACQEIFNRVFYAFKQFRLPMTVSLLCIALNFVLNLLLFESFAIAGISLSTSFCMLLYAVIMFFCLRREIGKGMGDNFFPGFWRVLLPLTVMLVTILIGRHFSSGSTLSVWITILASSLLYLAAAFATGFGKMIRR